MSRYQIGSYSYGYDNPLQEYFLQKSTGSRTKEIVGCLSPKAGCLLYTSPSPRD